MIKHSQLEELGEQKKTIIGRRSVVVLESEHGKMNRWFYFLNRILFFIYNIFTYLKLLLIKYG